jgi:pteridine reductase
MSGLKGRVALITGGGVRLGKELTMSLAAEGVKIAVHYGRSKEEADATVSSIRGMGGEAAAFHSDLRDVSKFPHLINEIADFFGNIDILVNSAAIFKPGTLAETSEELWDEHLAVNLKAPFFLAQAFALYRNSKVAGQIVNIIDWRIVRPRGDYIAYTIAKSGLLTMTQGLAQAMAPAVRVNAIAPGAILPPPGMGEDYLARLGDRLPLHKHGTPGDVTHALIYLLTAEFVTGQVIFVDGGEHL